MVARVAAEHQPDGPAERPSRPIYRVRRLYEAHKDKDGMVSSHRKGLVLRSVEHASEGLPIAAAKELLVRKAEELNIAVEEKRGRPCSLPKRHDIARGQALNQTKAHYPA